MTGSVPPFSFRAAKWGLGTLILLLISVCARHRDSDGNPTRTLPSLFNRHVNDATHEVVDVALDAAAETIILVGSLGDAGTVYPIAIEPISSGDGSFPETSSTTEPRRRISLKCCGDAAAAPCSIDVSHETAESNEDTRESGSALKPASASRRVFFLQTGPNPNHESSYQPLVTHLAAQSATLQVWMDDAAVASDDFLWLVRSMERDVLPYVTRFLGPIADVDGDGKLSICITTRLADLPAGEFPIEGLAQGNDFRTELPRPFSNQADVMFLSPTLRPGPHATAILAHEAAHLAVFSQRRAGWPLDDDWLNEGLAHFAEVECSGDWSNLERRLMAFAATPGDSPLIVVDAQLQGLWRHPGSRGASWMFLAWLADEFGPHIVGGLAQRADVGCKKLEAVTGERFTELFRRWSLAVWAPAIDCATHPAPGQRRSIELASFRVDPGHLQDATCPENGSETPGSESKAKTARLSVGLRRAGAMTVIGIDPTSRRHEAALRGTSVQAFRLSQTASSADRLRITAPRTCELQVTVVSNAAGRRRVLAVR